jgi:hypothetical protein
MSKNKEKFNDILDAIDLIQNQTVMSIRSSAECLIDSAEKLIKKIDAEGSKGFYSINHDCMRHSEATWRYSLRLCEMRLLKTDLEDQIRKNSSSDSNLEDDIKETFN